METMEMARVTSKGQITLPVNIRRKLRLKEGDKVLFVGEGDNISVVNASMRAFKDFQKAMTGEAERLGLKDEQDVVNMVKEIRAERARENENNAGY